MTLIQALDRDKFSRIWKPIRWRLFGRGAAIEAWDHGGPPPYIGWRFLPMLNHLTYGRSARYPHHDDGRAFIREEAVLLATLRVLGRERFCLEYLDDGWLLAPEEAAIVEASRLLPIFTTDYYLFDAQADWGVFCNPVTNISTIGGGPAFIDTYLRLAGGEEEIHKRLVQFDFGIKWGDAFGPWSGSYREELYRSFGWEAPPYPNKGEIFERRPDNDEQVDRWLPVFGSLFRESRNPLSVPNGWAAIPMRGHMAADGCQEKVTKESAFPRLEEYNSLLFILTGDGRWEMCLVALDHKPGSIWIAPPHVRSFDIPELTGRPVAAFGPQGDWFLVSRPEGVSLLAGEPALIARIVDDAGGWSAIRTRFEDWAACSAVPTAALDEVRHWAGWR